MSCSRRSSSATDTAPSSIVTLRTFLDCNAHYRKTATTLGVHENTVRYRLNQVKQLTAVDPDDLDSLLDVRFALRVLDADRGTHVTPRSSARSPIDDSHNATPTAP